MKKLSESIAAGSTPEITAIMSPDKQKRLRRKDKSNNTVKPTTPEALEAFKAAQDKTGVVYLSRVPPFMKPQKVRHLLEKLGELGRLYLAAEDASTHNKRKKYGGNTKKNFTEGWVEFKDKRVAKRVAATLNGTIMGGNKRNFYHDDLWTIKYLPKFKWNHLAERMAYEKAARDQRLRAEVAQAHRETKIYTENVDKAKMLAGMDRKKEEKRKRTEDTIEKEVLASTAKRTRQEASEAPPSKAQEIRRNFKQREAKSAESNLAVKPNQSPSAATKVSDSSSGKGINNDASRKEIIGKDVKNVLSKVYLKCL